MRGKVLNFRAFLVVALFVAAETFCMYLYSFGITLGVVLGIIILCAAGALLSLYIVRYVTGRSTLTKAVAFAISFLLSACALIFGVSSVASFNNRLALGGSRTVSGRVTAVDTSQNNYRVNLENLTFDGKEASGVLRLNINPSDNNVIDLIGCGDELNFRANIYVVPLNRRGKISGSAYRSGIYYNATVDSDLISLSVGKPDLSERVSGYVRGVLNDIMGEKYGAICFAMLTGDKSEMSGEVFDYYSAVGIGHIMAVSGLHIGFLVLLLGFVLKKLSKRVKYPIIGVLLLGYAAIADFSPSVVRAVIMTFVSGVGILVGGRRDVMSSLFCSFSLILAFKPFYMFETGFQLSFGAIYGIALFANSINRFLVKHGAAKKVANAAGGALSASVGLLPAQTYCFKAINILSSVFNVFIIPVISVLYMTVVALLPIALIPHLGAVLFPVKYMFAALDYMAYGLSQIPFISFAAAGGASVFLCYPMMFFASEFILVEKGRRARVIGLFCAMAAIIAISVLI